MKIHTIFTVALFLIPFISQAQHVFPLYPDKIPNSKPTPDEEKTVVDGITRVSNISRPTLSVFLPDKSKATGTAVIIFPGGGYWINAIEHEGTDVAKKLNEMGITAFVVKYRIPNHATMENPEIGPLQDAQQAIKTVRQRASEWGLKSDHIGIMGFSAGGHLASTAGTHFKMDLLPDAGNTNFRPDFMILIYPVISFQDSIGHLGSRDQLIGKQPPIEKINLYSNELQVTSETSPTFLVHASDDKVVKADNSILFYEALLHHRVPAELHLYQRGGHGFGLVNKTTNDKWIERLENWMSANGWLK